MLLPPPQRALISVKTLDSGRVIVIRIQHNVPRRDMSVASCAARRVHSNGGGKHLFEHPARRPHNINDNGSVVGRVRTPIFSKSPN